MRFWEEKMETEIPPQPSAEQPFCMENAQGVQWERLGPQESAEQAPLGEWIGEPAESAEHWHLQEQNYSCAVACQEFVAEELLGREFDESEMAQFAQQNGWFDAESGTAPEDVGLLLESAGLHVEREYQQSLQDIASVLESGGEVMVSVNNEVLSGSPLARLLGGTANHMVQVTGIHTDDPNNIRVVLNDPGVENGAGIEHSAAEFEAAWRTGNCYMVSAYNPKEEAK